MSERPPSGRLRRVPLGLLLLGLLLACDDTPQSTADVLAILVDLAALPDGPVDAAPEPPDGAPDAAVDAAVDAEPDAQPACIDDELFFVREVAPILQSECFGCHRRGGFAGRTRHVLQNFDEPGALEHNHEVLRRLVLNTEDPELLLKKPTAEIAHGGGRRFGRDDPRYKTLSQFVARTLQPGGCAAPGASGR